MRIARHDELPPASKQAGDGSRVAMTTGSVRAGFVREGNEIGPRYRENICLMSPALPRVTNTATATITTTINTTTTTTTSSTTTTEYDLPWKI